MVTTMRPKLNVKKILQAGKGRVRKEKNILLRERERIYSNHPFWSPVIFTKYVSVAVLSLHLTHVVCAICAIMSWISVVAWLSLVPVITMVILTMAFIDRKKNITHLGGKRTMILYPPPPKQSQNTDL